MTIRRRTEDGRSTRAPAVGYLVPEYPGQTHAMFTNEFDAVRGMGVDARMFSTRRPTRPNEPWTESAAETWYLYPLGVRRFAQTATWTLRAGTTRWRAVVEALRRSGRPPSGRLGLLALAGLGASLAAHTAETGVTHLHVHSCGRAADVARFSRLWGGPTYSLTLHGPLDDYGPDQSAKWAGAAFGTVITANLAGDVRALCGSALPPMAVAGMGVDVTSLARTRPYVPWPGRGPARIFSCGRLNPSKGHLDLIAAAATLTAAGTEVELTIVGEDEHGGTGYRRVLEAAVVRAGMQGVVHLVGASSQETIRRHLHGAHVFALASRAEPLGVAIMEAMAAGLPVVTTRAGGVPELITHGRDGLLVPPQSPDALGHALRLVLQDGELATRLGRAAAASIAERMRRTSSARVLVELIHEHAGDVPAAER